MIAPAEYPKASVAQPRTDLVYAALRATSLFGELRDDLLKRVVAAGLVHHVEVQRDRVIEAPVAIQGALCLVLEGQISIGVFDPQVLAERSRPQRDAIAGEQDGTLMPPGPLARAAKQNLALFREGELFNLEAVATIRGDDAVHAFSLARATARLIGTETVAWLAKAAPGIEHTIANALALTNARLRMITGIKHELLDFYVRNGLSVAGPTVRVRQLD
ncbi:MAG TPA: hypothetical protein VLT45_06605, partial [Kofleriaceae bacterium]|nr:hypothetical protein [Kofleriaceae bacterium]